MLSRGLLPSNAGGFRADARLRGRSWAWLIDLRRRLRVAVQIVDAGLQPVLPPPEGPAGTLMDEALAVRPEALRAAVSRTLDTGDQQVAAIEQGPIYCFRIGTSLQSAVLLVAGLPGEQAPQAVELLGRSLASAAGAHIGGGPSEGDEAERLRALVRLLSDPGVVGTQRQIIVALADALAIWHDVELCGYVQGEGDEAHLDVVLPGADRSRVPTRVPAALPDEGIVVLSGDEELGGEAGAALAAVRLGHGRGAWLLTVAGAFEDDFAATLEQYVTLVRQWMVAHSGAALLRQTEALSRDLLRAEHGDARAALARIAAVLAEEAGEATARVVMREAGGSRQTEGGAIAPDAADGVNVTRHLPDGRSVAVTLATTGRRCTAHDLRLTGAAADIAGLWCRPNTSGGPRERRQAARRADEVIDRSAAEALARGVEVSALVLGIQPRPAHGQTQRWLANVRSRLRVADLVGVIGDHELGVLLHDTPRDMAVMVAARLHQALIASGPAGAIGLRMGLASRTPGAPAAGSLLAEARAHPLPADE